MNLWSLIVDTLQLCDFRLRMQRNVVNTGESAWVSVFSLSSPKCVSDTCGNHRSLCWGQSQIFSKNGRLIGFFYRSFISTMWIEIWPTGWLIGFRNTFFSIRSLPLITTHDTAFFLRLPQCEVRWGVVCVKYSIFCVWDRHLMEKRVNAAQWATWKLNDLTL